MNRIIKYIVALFSLLAFLIYASGVIVKYSECSVTHEVKVSLFGISKNECPANADCGAMHCCCANSSEKTSCPKQFPLNCCDFSLEYLKEDVAYIASSSVEVKEPVVPLVACIEAEASALFKEIHFNEEFVDHKVPIHFSTILIFYNHHNKKLPSDAHLIYA